MLFLGHGSQINKTGTNQGAHTLPMLSLLVGQAEKASRLNSYVFVAKDQLGRPTGSTGVACGPLYLISMTEKKHALAITLKQNPLE